MKKSGKVRKGFRNFILSKIAKSYKDNEFLDVNIKTGNPDEPLNECIFAHKFILGALSPVLHEALENNPDDEILVIIPDFNSSTLRDFISLSYGYLSPDSVDRYARTAILELCKAFGMCTNETTATLTNLEEEVTTEDVERLLNAVEQHQVLDNDPDYNFLIGRQQYLSNYYGVGVSDI